MKPQNLINFGPADNRPPVRVRSLRNMIARPLGCEPRPVAIGEEFDIAAADLAEHCGEDIEVLAPAEILDVSGIEATDVSGIEAADFIEAGEFVQAFDI